MTYDTFKLTLFETLVIRKGHLIIPLSKTVLKPYLIKLSEDFEKSLEEVLEDYDEYVMYSSTLKLEDIEVEL